MKRWISRLFCWMGLHRWDIPGGHCEECGACDEFFGPHRDCVEKKGSR